MAMLALAILLFRTARDRSRDSRKAASMASSLKQVSRASPTPSKLSLMRSDVFPSACTGSSSAVSGLLGGVLVTVLR